MLCKNLQKIIFLIITVVSFVFFSSCSTTNNPENLSKNKNFIIDNNQELELDNIAASKLTNEALYFAKEGIELLNQGKYYDASSKFNAALKLNISNSYLQFFNAHTYHLIGKYHDSTYYPLAEEGYRVALNFDKNNMQAYFFLGQLYLDQKNYKAAKEVFLDAAYLESQDQDLFFSLSFASYFDLDPELALAALAEGCRLQIELTDNCVNNQALLQASLNFQPSNSDNFLPPTQKRVKDWSQFYKTYVLPINLENGTENNMNSDMDSEMDDTANSENTHQSIDTMHEMHLDPNSNLPDMFDPNNKMVIADIVIIESLDEVKTSRGINLLEGLTFQFGNPDGDPGYSFEQQNREGSSWGTSSSGSYRTIVRRLTIPAITYSLNIANIGTNDNEILAKPSLIATENQQSDFFVGKNIKAAATTSNDDVDGVEIDEDIGIKVSLTPTNIDGDDVTLEVSVKRTFITENAPTNTYSYQLTTSKTEVSATVDLKMNDSLIISGLTEQEAETVRSGIPFLQDIPVIQYLTSSLTTLDFEKSVLVIVTPRPPEFIKRSTKTIQDLVDREVFTESEARQKFIKKYESFQMSPSWHVVLQHLETTLVFPEFRAGDFDHEEWISMKTRSGRIKEAMKFLFY
jgi:hypothetical protein